MIPYENAIGEVSRSSPPAATFYMDFENNAVGGTISGVQAVAQTARLILETERYRYIIYSYQHGVELLDLFGRPVEFVCSELKRRVTEALCQDDRIAGTSDFQFRQSGRTISVSFMVQTIYGEIALYREFVI